MEYLFGLLVALLGGLFYYKKKADKSAADAKLAETRGRDAELKAQEDELKKAIEDIDAGIKKAQEELKAKRIKEDNMTLKERRDRYRNRIK